MVKYFALLVAFVSLLLFSQNDLEYAFDQIKDTGADYRNIGTVCEELTILEFQNQYPPDQYNIVGQIEYARQNNIVLGELDVVVFENSTNYAVVIAEVKCWKNLFNAYKKALKQQKRFREHVFDKGLKIYCKNDEHDYFFQAHQFAKKPVFMSVSQEGGEQAGFEETIPYSLGEIYKLQKRLLACQKSGQCAPVLHK